jgi:glucose/arabinose dehydrogenase
MKSNNLHGFIINRTASLIGLSLLVIILFFACKKNDVNPAPISSGTPGLSLIAENLVSPLSVVQPPDNSKRLFIVDQAGKIWIVNAAGTMQTTPFLDISSKMVTLNPNYDERGLLSLAFHPSFSTNGKFYVFYTAPPRAGGPAPGVNWNSLTRVSEFKVSATDANVADISSERIILEADHPQSNHNGGTVAFGPDGYLYISIGDGGGKDDDGAGHLPDWYAANRGGNAQNITANLMGKILRIDVNSGTNYSIPSDNPYATSATAMKEIFAFGFRNPYRFSFDKGGTHQLIAGDAGQSLYEEVDLVNKGGNYGWNVKEGNVCFNTDSDLLTRSNCPTVDSAGNPLIGPVLHLVNTANPAGNGVATVIVGGNVYRGTALPALQGKYIFGIFSQGGIGAAGANAKLYTAVPSTSSSWNYEALDLKNYSSNLGYYLKGFGEDQAGELYITVTGVQGVSGTTGKVYKLVAQ